MTIDTVLYGVYLIQILLVSFYVPSRILRRARGLIAGYPPSEYPKLYPVPVATIERMLRSYRYLNLGVGVLGLALLAAAGFYGYTIDPVWRYGDVTFGNPVPTALAYTVLQMLTASLFSCYELLYLKRMRDAPRDSAIRTAELKARRLADFVSPALLGTAAATYAGAALVLLFLGTASMRKPPLFSFGITYMFVVMTIMNIGIVGCLVWMLRGRKQDPYQAHEDRARIFRVTAIYLVAGSMLMSVQVAVSSALIAFDFVHYVPILVSVVVQLVAMVMLKLTPAWLGQTNFDVYKPDRNRNAALAAHD